MANSVESVAGLHARRALSALMAAVMALSAMVAGASLSAAPALAQDEPLAEPVAITVGALDWGIRTSFRNYAGSGEASDGLAHTDNGYRWPLREGTYDPATSALSLSFNGSVRYQAHCELSDNGECPLDVRISRPRVEIRSGTSQVFADVSSRDLTTGQMVDFPGVDLARLDLRDAQFSEADGQSTWSSVGAILTENGSPAFAGFYQPGEPLDSLSLTYAGPGSVPPVLDEPLSVPGEVVYRQAQSVEGIPGVRMVIEDDLGLMLAKVGGGGVRAYDSETLEEVARVSDSRLSYTTLTGSPRHNMFDYVSASKTFAGLTSTGIGLATWNATANSFDIRFLTLGAGSSGTGSSVAAHPTNNEFWARSGNTLRHVDLSPAGEPVVRTFPLSGVEMVLGVGADGTLVASARVGGLVTVRVAASGDDVVVTPIAGTEDHFGGVINGIGNPPGRAYATVGPEGGVIVGQISNGMVAFVGPGSNGWALTQPLLETGDLITGLSMDVARNTLYVSNGLGLTQVFAGSDRVGQIAIAWNTSISTAVRSNGDLYAYTSAPNTVAVYRRVGVTPSVVGQPQDVTVTSSGVAVPVTFSVDVAGEPAPALQWQTRPAGSLSWTDWTDIADAHADELTVAVTPGDDGREYRVMLTNAAADPGTGDPVEVGRVASNPATVTVFSAPSVVQDLADLAVTAGDDAEFKVFPAGNPYPEITWQRYAGGFWWNVGPDDDGLEVDGGFLTVTSTNVDQDGTRFRARLRNTEGTTYTRAATLAVAPRDTTPRYVVGGDLEWGIRASFRNYIVSPIAHGQIVTEAPATRAEDGTFTFPAVSGMAVDRQVDATFDGAVHFSGHVGMGTPPGVPALDMRISAIRVEVAADGQSGRVVADVVSRGLYSGELATFDDVHFADLDLSGVVPAPVDGGVRYEGVPATLSAAGVPAFADFYAEGSPLDALSFILALSTDEPQPEVPLTPTQSFVTAALTDFLGAAPSEAQVASGVASVESVGKAAFLRELSTSDAWLAAVIKDLYTETLGRPASEADVEFWAGRIRSGWSVARVAASFYAAPEYFDGIGGGTNATWVADLYESILNRSAGAAEVDYWVAETVAKGRGNVALRFFQTPESARNRVTGLYRDVLGRAPAPGDVAFWGPQVTARGDLTLAVSLAASAEYQARSETRFP